MPAPYQAQQMIDAMRAAYAVATATRRTYHIIDQGGDLRITANPSPQDKIVVADVTPPRWNKEVEHAVVDAFGEFADAMPAIQRAANIVAGAGEIHRDEIAEGILRRYVLACDVAAAEKRFGPKPPRRPGLFTRMFGAEA